jgi:WD40 repeat protein
MHAIPQSFRWKAFTIFFAFFPLSSQLLDNPSSSGKPGISRSLIDLNVDPPVKGAIKRFGTTRFRFAGELICIAYAPCGRMLASGGEDSGGALLKLWDVTTGKETAIRRFGAYGSEINAIAFSPDGRTLAACCLNEKIQLLDVVGQDLRPRCELPTSRPWSVAFSPDGKVLACGAGKSIQFWDPVTCKQIREIGRHEHVVVSLVFSRDGRFLASGSRAGNIRLWLVETGKQLHRLSHPGSPISLPVGFGLEPQEDITVPPFPHLAFSPDSKTLACAGGKSLVLWEAATGKEVWLVKTKEIPVEEIVFSPDGKTVASVGRFRDRAIRLWNAQSGKQLREILGFPCLARSIAYSPNGKTLACGSGNGTISLWDVESGRERPVPPGHQAEVLSVAFSPNSLLLASGSSDGTARLWDLATGREVWRLSSHRDSVESIAFSPDGRILASGSADKAIFLWDVATGQKLRQLGPHDKEVLVVAFAPDGKTLASGSSDRVIRLWEISTGKEVWRIQGQGHPGRVNSVAFSPDGSILASGGGDNVIYLWNVATGKKLREFQGLEKHQNIYCVAFSPDGKSLASACADGKLCLWDIRTGRQIRQFKTDKHAITTLVFGPGGKTLATIGADFAIRLWEVATGGQVRQIPGTEGYLRSLALSPDGKMVAAGGGGDFCILLWDLTRQPSNQRATTANLSREELDDLWRGLLNPNASRAYQDIWKLVGGKQQTVSFFQDRLRPVRPVQAQRLKQLIDDLDSTQYDVRKKAVQELEELYDCAEPALLQALASSPSLEVRTQAERLLARLDPAAPEPLRMQRAVTVLEDLATPEARTLLTRLAKGAPEAWLTQDAQSALRRLAKK